MLSRALGQYAVKELALGQGIWADPFSFSLSLQIL